MAKTAVINKRGRGGRFVSKKRSGKRRRRNYGAAAAEANPRRRRRRSYGAAAPRRRRRRNPASPYASSGYRREPNPLQMGGIGRQLQQLVEIIPSGTAGIMGARFALKQSGAWSPDAKGVMQPGAWQALAIWLGANISGAIISTVFKSPSKGLYAKIAGLSFGGDLFLRTRFLRESAAFQNNFSLAGLGDDDEDEDPYSDGELLNGFQSQSSLGEMFTDSDGNTWQQQGGGWALAGMGAPGEIVQGPDGTLYQLSGGMGLDSMPGSGASLAGFQSQSSLGGLGAARARHNPNSSFGYTP